MRVAIISFEGPGDGWIGALRLRALARQLQLCGDKVLLITSEVNCGRRLDEVTHHVMIPSPRLLTMISKARASMGVTRPEYSGWGPFKGVLAKRLLGMVRLHAGYVERELFVPDSRVLWRRYASRNAWQAVSEFRPEVIVSLGNPVSHMVARDVKSRTKNVLWIAELQDPWSSRVDPPVNPITRELARRREMLTMAMADVLVCVTEGIARLYSHRAKVVIPFGSEFDPLDFPTSVVPFTIGYYGNLYRDRYQSATVFIKALAEVVKKNEDMGGRIRFRIFSRSTAGVLRKVISQAGLDTKVIFESPLHRDEVFESMSRNHVLVSLQGRRYDYAIAAKVYDYLMTGRPILSVTSVDSCEGQFLSRFAGAFAADTVSRVAEALTILLRIPAPHSYGPSRPAAAQYTQKVTAAQFAHLVHVAVDGGYGKSEVYGSGNQA